jgi:hypothetical protein
MRVIVWALVMLAAWVPIHLVRRRDLSQSPAGIGPLAQVSARCELVHTCPHSTGSNCSQQEDQAMPRLPEWLTDDLMIIVFSITLIGTVYWIAP